MTTRRRGATLLLAALLGAAPAAALDDVTGVYRGTTSCERTDDQGDSRTSLDVTLLVDDAGSNSAYAYLNNSGYFFRLAAVGEAGGASGRLAGAGCSSSAVSGGPLLQLEVKLKPGSSRGSLKGELIIFNVGANAHYVEVCRLTLRRTETTLAQPIPGCP